ncbi:MAG: hypothetical protein K5893_13085 [Prevotella sp.]|nr:hypothetical protein [Prevotella sp.]
MKRFAFLILTLVVCSSLSAQDVLTVVYATSDDGFVNVRKSPSSKATILSKVYAFSHGLGNGVLHGQRGNWSRVSVGRVDGWAYTKYLGMMTWFDGQGRRQLIANRGITPIYTDNYADGESYNYYGYVKKGTILADQFQEDDGYYILTTAHDNLYIKKEHAIVVNVR